MKYNRGTALRVVFALLVLALSQGALATTYYTYDILGRVTQVVESDGTTTQYSYDANGNVTSINRIAGTSVLSIGSVSTSSGATGSSVTITGSGFSSIPSQDVVTFNGVAATVTYASGNRLVVTVPAGATTGDISITTQTSSATSDNSFTVVPVSITSISPSSGVAGGVLTVNGGGFDPTPANNTVLINGVPATVTSATVTQLQVTVPSGATPGHVSVNAPLGSAVSAGYFFVPASGYTLSQVAQVSVQAPGSAGDVLPINGANQVGVILFDGVAGQRMSMVATNLSAAAQYTVFAPDGSTLANNLSFPSTEVALPPLPQTGTYAWYYRPQSVPASGTYQLLTDVVGGLPTDGTPTATSLAPGQNATYTFLGTAGQSYNLTLTSMNASAYIGASVFNPDGSLLGNCGPFQAYYNQNQSYEFTVGTSGTYTLRIMPIGSGGLVPATFNTYVVQDFSATLTAGTPGPTVGITLVPEQNGRINFTATANQTLALYFGTASINPDDPTSLVLSGPGPLPGNASVGNSQSATLNLPNLGAGNYLVTIRPFANGAAIATTATLASGVTGTLTADGTPATVQTYVPGQDAYLRFNGTQGQNLTLVLSQLTLTPTSTDSASVTVTNPDGSAYKSGTCYTTSSPGCTVSLDGLPQTGTYTVTVSPDGQATMGAALSLPSDVTGTLTLGNSTTVALTSPGQQAVLSFVATSNEALILSVGSIATIPANTPVTFYIYNASGALVTQASLTSDGTLNVGTLEAGTYSVVVVPGNAATGSMSVNMEPAPTTALPIDGSSTTVTTVAPGQDALATFSATVGQSIALSLTNLTMSPASGSHVNWYVTAPDGSTVASPGNCSPGGSGCTWGIFSAPQTGTYTLNLVPVNSNSPPTLSVTITLAQNITGALTLGTTQTLNLSKLGQNALFTFSVTSGQRLTASLSGIATTPAGTGMWMGVYTTSGYLVSGSATTTGEALNLSNLTPGNYLLWVGWLGDGTPGTATMQLSFQPGVTPSLPIDGSSNTVTTLAPGQYASPTFSASTGQSIALSLTNLTMSPASGSYVNWYVTAPDGSTVASPGNCSPGGSGCTWGIFSAPQTGTYTLNLVPVNNNSPPTLSVTITLAQNVTGALTSGSTQTLNLSELGQNALFTFSVTSGESLHASLSGIVTTPAGTGMWMGAYTTSGYLETGAATTTGETLNLSSLAPGNYLLWVGWLGDETPGTATMQLSLQ